MHLSVSILQLFVATSWANAQDVQRATVQPPPAVGYLQISSETLDRLLIDKVMARQRNVEQSKRRAVRGRKRLVKQDVPATWEVYVPRHYIRNVNFGVFVYISPTPSGRMPSGYAAVMDKHNLVWIGANASGNDQPLERRMWLALEGLAHIQRRYRIDRDRRFVGGLSGGGRTSSILSLTLPEEFTGGYFFCGCNFYRDVHISGNNYRRGFWPGVPDHVLQRAQRRRYVFCTGETDGNNADTHRVHDACAKAGFEHLLLQDIPGMGHTAPPPEWFDEGISFLDEGSAARQRPPD